VKLVLIVAGGLIAARFGSLIARCIAELAGFGIQQFVQSLFDRASSQLTQVLLNIVLINLDDFAQILRNIP
jgi:hypothetical protein